MGKMKPELRFEGFDGDWVEKRLSEIAERITRKNINLESSNPLTISAQHGLVSQTDYFNWQVASKNLSNYYLLYNGDFAYNKSYSSGYPVGTVKRLEFYDKGVLSTLYIIFKPTNADSNFLKHYYETKHWYSEIDKIAEEGARNHGLLNVSPMGFLEKKIYISKSNFEQKKIGLLFEKIEKNLKLRKNELNKLKQYKQAMLEKMFPREGETVPEIRFAGFTDPWEQCKLGEVAQITMGQSPNSENYTDNPNDHILVQGNADMKNGRVSPRVWTTQVTKQAEKNDLILSVRAPVGDVGKTDYDVVLGRGVAGIKGNEFIFQLLTRMKENGYWRNLSTGSTFESINSNDIKEAYVLIPNNEEQVKIGLFFSNLDYLITLHQRKLKKLENMKRAYLDKMYI